MSQHYVVDDEDFVSEVVTNKMSDDLAEPPRTSGPPPGMLEDAKGRWVRETMVKPLDRARHELVVEMHRDAKAMHAALTAFKRKAMADLQAFLELSAEQYGVKLEGAKGNVTLTSFDGKLRVTRAIADRIAFDERLTIAKALIDECIKEWSDGTRPELRALVSDAFQVDAKGHINTERVLRLRTIAIEHPKWKQAMQAINDSIKTESTRMYIRFHERVGEDSQHRAVELDLSRV